MDAERGMEHAERGCLKKHPRNITPERFANDTNFVILI